MKRNRQLLSLLPAIATSVLACACGSNTPTAPGSGRSDGRSAKADKAVKFARCMRKNGIGQFPDPPASRNFTIDEIANGSSLNTTSPAFTQALSACKTLEPTGFAGTSRNSQQQGVALQFAACMRKNGVPDFPDPTRNSPLIDTNNIPSSKRPGGMTALHAAQQKCTAYSSRLIGRRQ